ncbi:MAG: radical SAM protein, partial [Magnetococcales bacterium]|nr:radical SAM protein [Magnetococcales bacterium]
MTVDLKALVDARKFIPFFVARSAIDREKLAPVAIELHWTSDCNYDCVHCSYGSRRQNKGRLSPEVIDALVNHLIALQVKAVYLSGGGEPTLVKGWTEYARRMLDGGIELALITNGA